MYYHLCASLEVAAGQVLWDTGPQVTTNDIIWLLQTWFGTGLLAERFKAKMHARRRRHGEPFQQLYEEVCCLVALAYHSAEVSLTTYVAREHLSSCFISANCS